MTLTGQARTAGAMGWPIAHSRSPRLHGYWLARHGIDGAYIPLPVEPAHFAQALRILPALGFAGVNVTVPHKEMALATVDEASPTAQRIGAVNTVVTRADGSLFGDNTDAFGFIENLRAEAGSWTPAAGPAVVLGAGGAARAICVALLDAGVETVRLVNRTVARAEALSLALGDGIKVYPWPGRGEALAEAGLLVNTTTLGMEGQPPLDLELDGLPRGAVVCDIVYVPLETPLLSAARRRGHAVVDGLGMLLHQARPGFAAWFGVEPEVTAELKAFVAEGLVP